MSRIYAPPKVTKKPPINTASRNNNTQKNEIKKPPPIPSHIQAKISNNHNNGNNNINESHNNINESHNNINESHNNINKTDNNINQNNDNVDQNNNIANDGNIQNKIPIKIVNNTTEGISNNNHNSESNNIRTSSISKLPPPTDGIPSIHNLSKINTKIEDKASQDNFQTKLEKLRNKIENVSEVPKIKLKEEKQKDSGDTDSPSYSNSLMIGKMQVARSLRKKLKISKAARAAGRNEEAIKVNLDSVKNKTKFGRLVIYSVNCLANLAENRFNCESMVEQNSIKIAKEIILHHKGNAGVMKEVSRMLANIARASPEYAKMIVDEGLLSESLDVLKTNPNECGVYALEIIDAVLKNAQNSTSIAKQLKKLGAIDILKKVLETNIDNSELATAIIRTLNLMSAKDSDITKSLGDEKIYNQILDTMKRHPNEAILAVHGLQLLQRMALMDKLYMEGIKAYNAVSIISASMQANPDMKTLVSEGASALKILAGQDDVTRALEVLFNIDKYDNKMITQALGLLANLALITENGAYIGSKGGLNALLGLIKLKCKNATPEDIKIIANAIRATGRLLVDPKLTANFSQQGGLDLLKNMLADFGEEETIMNAVMDALCNLAKNSVGNEMITGSGIIIDAIGVLVNHPEYAIMVQKFTDLLKLIPLNDGDLQKKLIDAGLLNVITKSLQNNYDNADTVIALMDLIMLLININPKLTEDLAKNNAQDIIQAIRANKDDFQVLKHIFDCIHVMASADSNTLIILKKAGLDDELQKMLKQNNCSDAIVGQIKSLLDSLTADGIEFDLSNVLSTLKGLGMPLDEINTITVETEVKEDLANGASWNDPSIVLERLSKMINLLDDPNNAKQFVMNGQVGNILDNIQNFYENPNIVVHALNALIKCTTAPEVFPLLKEAGVPEAVIQCMLEHSDNLEVQLAGMKLLARLAAYNDALIYDSICEPINIEAALKALNNNIKNPNIVTSFCDLICNLLKDSQITPQITQMLANEDVVNGLTLALNTYVNDSIISQKIQESLTKLNPYLSQTNEINQHGAIVARYGTITLAQLSKMSLEELKNLMSSWDHSELLNTLHAAREPKLVQSVATEINTRLTGGDTETYDSIVSQGGISDLLTQIQNNFDNPLPLQPCLETLGILSTDDRLKTLLGMHGTIRLILECIHRHPNDIELLDKCCYILSNLSYNNAQNMTLIIELGGVTDIVNILKNHKQHNFLCEAGINVLVNLCHNSDKNKTFIARTGGAKSTIAALKQHYKCYKEDDVSVVVASFRCLANLAFVAENVKQLIKLDIVPVIMDTMQCNQQQKDLIQMGIVVLANLSSHQIIAAQMVHLGVLDLILEISKTYPDELETQLACLGCIGNLMNEQNNAIAFLDKNGHKQIFEIMDQLIFEESILSSALKLIKVLATNSDISTHLAVNGGIDAVTTVMKENIKNINIVLLSCQALCKLITTIEAAKYIQKVQLVDTIVEISEMNNNWANIQIMNELIKVIVNISGVEENAQPYARNGGVSLLRAIEVHGNNPIFLNNAAMALSKLSTHHSSSRSLVKRGAVAVILSSCQINAQRRGIITRYVRTLTNFLYTENKSGEEIQKLNGEQTLQQIVNQHKDFPQLLQEWDAFEKAMRLKAKKFVSSQQYSLPIRDRLQINNARLISAGTIIKKHEPGGKTKKKLVRSNEDCTLLIFEDPASKKEPKQLNMKSVRCIQWPIENIKNYNELPKNTCFVIIAIDPNGCEFPLVLETKTETERERWVEALQDLQLVNQTSQSSRVSSKSSLEKLPSRTNLQSDLNLDDEDKQYK